MSYNGPPYYPQGGQPPAYYPPPYLPPPTNPYAAAPVTMPIASPQHRPVVAESSFVSNYLYHYPPTVVEPTAPVRCQDFIEWYPSNPHSAADLSQRAVVAGREPGWDASPLWVIRAYHNGDLVPGKLAIKDRRAYIPINGREIPVHNFEVLCAQSRTVEWIAASAGQIPEGAIRGGNTHTGEPLYVGRTKHSRSLTPGKVHPSHGCLYISFGGIEIPHKYYEVLCRVPIC